MFTILVKEKYEYKTKDRKQERIEGEEEKMRKAGKYTHLLIFSKLPH